MARQNPGHYELLYWRKSQECRTEVDANRHFPASWASQPHGLLVYVNKRRFLLLELRNFHSYFDECCGSPLMMTYAWWVRLWICDNHIVACAVTAGGVLLPVEEIGDSVDNSTPSTTQTSGSAASSTDTDSAVQWIRYSHLRDVVPKFSVRSQLNHECIQHLVQDTQIKPGCWILLPTHQMIVIFAVWFCNFVFCSSCHQLPLCEIPLKSIYKLSRCFVYMLTRCAVNDFWWITARHCRT